MIETNCLDIFDLKFLNYKIVDKNFVEYEIQVFHKYSEQKWTKICRYNELFELHKVLDIFDYPFPKKKLFENLSHDFINQRKTKLENYF